MSEISIELETVQTSYKVIITLLFPSSASTRSIMTANGEQWGECDSMMGLKVAVVNLLCGLAILITLNSVAHGKTKTSS